MSLKLPVRVQGHDSEGRSWEEMASVRDISPGGVCFSLGRPLTRGHVLFLSLPLPKRFRSFDLMEPSYRVYALVRNVEQEGRLYKIGVMFLGKHPPRGHEDDPSGLFLLPSDPSPRQERRQHPRLDIFVNVRLRRLGASETGPQEERSIAENIGKGGARVMTSLAVVKGELILFEEVDGDFKTRAEIRRVYVGEDHVTRLNLAFVDALAPDRLVSTA